MVLDPSVVNFFMHQCTDEDDIDDFASTFEYPHTGGLILVPLNDAMTTESSSWKSPGGGSHWSLMVIVIDKGERHGIRYWHWDSVPNNSNNIAAAKDVAAKMSENIFSNPNHEVIQAKAPEQKNGYDCGLHMLATAQIFAKETDKLKTLPEYEVMLQEHFEKNPDACSQLRSWMANEILKLAEGK